MDSPVRIAIFGDLHAEFDRLDPLLERLRHEPIDLVLQTGDVGQDPPRTEPDRQRQRAAHDDSVRRVLQRLQGTFHAPVVFVPGNHDLPDPPPVPGAINVDGRSLQVAGLTLAGLGGAGPGRFGFPYEWDEVDAASRLARLGRPVDLLLCHTPPAATTLDRIYSGRHVGSTAVRDAISRLSPRLFVCGHIHEAAGLETVESVPCLNAGALGEPFGECLAWIVEWQAGPRKITRLRLDGSGRLQRDALL